MDARPEEENFEQLNGEELAALKQSIKSSLNFDQPLNLNRRKAEIICKLHKKDETYVDLIAQLQQLATGSSQVPGSGEEALIKSKVMAMYMFELLAEYHLP